MLDSNNCNKVQNFLNLMYQNNMIPIIKKPTRKNKKTAATIDRITRPSQAVLLIQILKPLFLKVILMIIFRFVFFLITNNKSKQK